MRKRNFCSEYQPYAAYDAAQKLAWQLKEMAKLRGYDPRGIKVVDKKRIKAIRRAKPDAQVTWFEGPADWATEIELVNMNGVYVEAFTGNTLSFYNL